MAEAIMAVWRDPQTAEGRAQTLHEIVTGQFSWASQAAKIVELARNAMAQTNARSLV
jgi:hypothetical protein